MYDEQEVAPFVVGNGLKTKHPVPLSQYHSVIILCLVWRRSSDVDVKLGRFDVKTQLVVMPTLDLLWRRLCAKAPWNSCGLGSNRAVQDPFEQIDVSVDVGLAHLHRVLFIELREP